MAIKKFKPTYARAQTDVCHRLLHEITTDEPEKSLTGSPEKLEQGATHQGRITVRHQGGGHKRKYRIIDFKRDKDGVPAKVAAIEYDPNRSARIALLTLCLTERKDIFYLPMESRWGIRFIQEKMPISRYRQLHCL
jgi:large subunit ribosomal protein L2